MKKLLIFMMIFIFISFSFAGEKDLSPLELHHPCYWLFGDSIDQAKLQTSFKYNLLRKYESGLFLGYSQNTHWKLYDKSSPLVDTRYSPEIFIKSKYVLNDYIDYIIISPYEHSSNGRDGVESRSIDKCYIQAQSSVGDKINFGLNLKGFYYYSVEKKNKDYREYSNYYEAKLFISINNVLQENAKDEIYIKVGGLSKGFIEAGIITRKIWKINPRLYVQVYHGYLESMLRYNEKTTSIRIGIIFK